MAQKQDQLNQNLGWSHEAFFKEKKKSNISLYEGHSAEKSVPQSLKSEVDKTVIECACGYAIEQWIEGIPITRAVLHPTD